MAGAECLARRVFVMTSLISGLSMATTRVVAQAVHTDSAGLVAAEVKIPVSGGDLPGYVAHPDGRGPFPIVLVMEEIFGVDAYIQDVCRRLAKAGYLAVAPEVYAPYGNIGAMTSVPEIFTRIISRAPDEALMGDLDSTAKWAAQHGGDANRLGIIGFCRGGRAAWLYAVHSSRVKAAVAFYGELDTATSPIQPQRPMDVAGDINCPVLALFGGKDQIISKADIDATETAVKKAGKTAEMVIYPDAGHGFFSDTRPSYVKADAEDAWTRTLRWLKKYGVS